MTESTLIIRKVNKREYSVVTSMIICVCIGIIYSVTAPSIVSILVGYIGTLYICYKIWTLDYENGFLLLMGTQFLRAVIRVGLGSSNLSFLLIAFPLFIAKYLLTHQGKTNKVVLLPIVLVVWDLMVSFSSGLLAVGDQILWGLAFAIVVSFVCGCREINITKINIVFGLAIWGICLINIFAEIRTFGQTLVPSMYGVWNSFNGYYMFGKGYVDVAGGNEIAQYIPLFIAMAVLDMKKKPIGVRVFYISSSVFFFYCGLMCIARAFYVEMLLFLALYLIHSSKNLIKMLATIVVIGIFATVISFKYEEIQPVLNAVLIRFQAGNGSRQNLIQETLEIFQSSISRLLFGIGTNYNSMYETAHNIFIDSLVSLGALGTIIYISTFVRMFATTLKKRVIHGISGFIPIIMLLVYKMISGSVKDVPFYFIVMICLSFLQEFNDRRKRSDHFQ